MVSSRKSLPTCPQMIWHCGNQCKVSPPMAGHLCVQYVWVYFGVDSLPYPWKIGENGKQLLIKSNRKKQSTIPLRHRLDQHKSWSDRLHKWVYPIQTCPQILENIPQNSNFQFHVITNCLTNQHQPTPNMEDVQHPTVHTIQSLL